MKKAIFLLFLFCAAQFLKAETVDISTSVTATATLLGAAQLTVRVKTVSGDQDVSNLTWGSVSGTTTYKEAQQYVQLQYSDNYYSWGMRIYTDNDSWGGSQGGPGNRLGLINTATDTVKLPLLWRIYDEAQGGGIPCTSSTNWAEVVDDNDSDWDTNKTTYAQFAYGSLTYANIADFPTAGRTDSDQEDMYLYFGADFSSASTGDYSGIIYFDLYHY